MRHKISTDAILTGLFVAMLLLLLLYGSLRGSHPAPDPLFMLFGQVIGLVFLALIVFCSFGLVLMVGRRLYGVCHGD